HAPHYPGTPTTHHPPRQLDAVTSPAPVLASPVTPTVSAVPATGARRLLRANNSATARPAFLRWSSWIRATCESLKIDSSITGYRAMLSISLASFCTASACADNDRNSGSAKLADNRQASSGASDSPSRTITASVVISRTAGVNTCLLW